MAKEIILTRGFKTIVDDEDYEYLSQFKWYASFQKKWYAVRALDNKTAGTRMNRIIMKVVDPKIIVDHKDGDSLNNQKSNLRICNNSQNGANRKKVRGASKYLGVSFYYKKWIAQIKVNGTILHLGSFELEIDAAKAYDSAARLHHGEFASPNFNEEK